MKLLYIEKEVENHPLVQRIKKRFASIRHISCAHYGEIFNRHNQHFRLQKSFPALILAKKHKKLLHEIPPNYGIGALHNFYFSHILNCPFDCEYCFLQGLYKSAHYVLFVNYEDFFNAISEKISAINDKITFFSGYDGDSLALDPITGFLDAFIPFFEKHHLAELELRTKSIRIHSLLKTASVPNVIVAYSLNPQTAIDLYEKKTPPLSKRIEALVNLQNAGWKIGLRFDPVLYFKGYKNAYQSLLEEIFQSIRLDSLHSVTLGTFRLPSQIYANMKKILPKSHLLAQVEEQKDLVSYQESMQQEMLEFCKSLLLNYVPEKTLFVCKESS